MCDVQCALAMKSTDCDSTQPEPDQLPPAEVSRLKRTFTLPRNPLTRISKRKPKTTPPADNNNADTLQPPGDVRSATLARPNNRDADDVHRASKKVFRRPSFRKFINKIAQHIGGVQLPNGESRVPPVGLQTWGPDDTPGVTGLRNHGNTCFINAVLQCISHTDVLAEYFVLDRYKIDLSRRNKLNSKKHGTKGEVTEQLAVLLKALWSCQYNPEFSTIFKQIVERYGVQYKGTQQHDALEFLIWLLDKVHEDLNMAPKKKFRSIKTLGRPDEVIAAETLENYRRQNNSFIHSVFQAQYRSSLSCPRCLTQSNTFDPFQCISVQLPQLFRHSVYVTVLYTSQQPREVKIGVSLPSGATVSELRDLLESDTSIARTDMLLTEIGDHGFLRTFTDAQSVNGITEVDPVYCIEVPQLKDVDEETQGAYVLLCWINAVEDAKDAKNNNSFKRFGSPYTMQVNRETSYADLQKLMLKEMAPILHDDILTSSQPAGVYKMRISDPAYNFNEPATYLEPSLEHPLFMEAIDQALALCSEDGGPPHVKLVLEWSADAKRTIIADDSELVEEHSSVKQLKTQALQGGAPLTLEECLRHYTKAETLDDAWRCPQCQKYQPVIKTLDMWSLPDILVFHFKRFRQQTVKGRTSSTKLTTMVDFPVHAFDMTPHLANKSNANLHQQQQPPTEQSNPVIMNGVNWSPWKRSRKQSTINDNTYDLYAVCYHHGTDLETGHYTAACKNPYDNNWYLYDDAKVTNLSAESAEIGAELVNNSAYILFYQKRTGIYVSSSSNSSSAASTSSVGSIGDHWVVRMPKFVPPKLNKEKEKEKEKKPTLPTVTNTMKSASNTNISTNATKVNNEATAPIVSSNSIELELDDVAIADTADNRNEVDMNKEDIKLVDEVTLRNSQNTIYNSNNSIRKVDEKNENKKYITGIYINGTDDPERKCKSLVVEADTKCVINKERLSWMSPQPMRKLHESQVSV
ncbi:ubiquitin carboxyl-terminal hydrolase 31 [Atheta coriaria]|uniref:ubiquitin carboxyl-terminal hydrolase 31 n=1 Tax=Dalotia coriaria TaxID=877792 RepID=UPI0031F38BA7